MIFRINLTESGGIFRINTFSTYIIINIPMIMINRLNRCRREAIEQKHREIHRSNRQMMFPLILSLLNEHGVVAKKRSYSSRSCRSTRNDSSQRCSSVRATKRFSGSTLAQGHQLVFAHRAFHAQQKSVVSVVRVVYAVRDSRLLSGFCSSGQRFAATSFGFGLTTDTLAFWLIVPPDGPIEDFHLQVQ